MNSYEEAMRRVIDQQEIRDVLARYCRGIDRMDRQLIESVYHPDATDDHVRYRGSAAGFVNWVMNELLPSFTWTMHNLGTSIINVRGDVAYSETYAICYHGAPLDGIGERLMTVGVRYIDRFERRQSGTWLIADRVVVLEWRRNEDIEDARATSAPEVVHGRRMPDDLLYTQQPPHVLQSSPH